jgi:hypothetical protein
VFVFDFARGVFAFYLMDLASMAEFNSGISDCLWRQKMPKSGALEMRLSHGVAGAFSVSVQGTGASHTS